eukprot:jgi/Botrbrau1/17788/Bobra.0127s0039.1
MVVAGGPFTAGPDLSYQPLEELLSYISKQRPGLVVLLGPFVDVEAGPIQDGTLDETFTSLFDREVLQRLRAVVRAHGSQTQFVVIPSIRDAHAEPAFPQPALRNGVAEAGIHFLPNPCTFSVNGVTVGTCTHDVLRDLSAAEASKGVGDRMAALASHLVGQRSYYPLFPPSLGSCLDTSLGKYLRMPCSPDLLLLPSDLAPFAKAVPLPPLPHPSDTSPGEPQPSKSPSFVCVNPGRLSKFTFAHMRIGPSSTQLGMDAGPLADRCRAEIRRV